MMQELDSSSLRKMRCKRPCKKTVWLPNYTFRSIYDKTANPFKSILGQRLTLFKVPQPSICLRCQFGQLNQMNGRNIGKWESRGNDVIGSCGGVDLLRVPCPLQAKRLFLRNLQHQSQQQSSPFVTNTYDTPSSTLKISINHTSHHVESKPWHKGILHPLLQASRAGEQSMACSS